MHSWLNWTHTHTHNIYDVYVYPTTKTCFYVCVCMYVKQILICLIKSIFLVLQIFTTIFLPCLLVFSFKTWGSYSWPTWVPIHKTHWIKIPGMILGYTNGCLTQFCIVTQEVFVCQYLKLEWPAAMLAHEGDWAWREGLKKVRLLMDGALRGQPFQRYNCVSQ